MITVERATAADILHVARNMRERDRQEFAAVSPADTRDDLADLLLARYTGRPEVLAVRRNDVPIVIGGVFEFRPRSVQLMLFATDEFPKVTFWLTRFVKQRLLAPMKARGIHRIEAVTSNAYPEMHRWLRSLGLKYEAPKINFGKNGELFVEFAWVS